MTEQLEPGDKIRVTKDGLSAALVEAGDVLEVTGRASDTVFIADGWRFPDDREGKGWERVES